MLLWPVSLAMVTKAIPLRRMYMMALALRGCRSSLGIKLDIYWRNQKKCHKLADRKYFSQAILPP